MQLMQYCRPAIWFLMLNNAETTATIVPMDISPRAVGMASMTAVIATAVMQSVASTARETAFTRWNRK